MVISLTVIVIGLALVVMAWSDTGGQVLSHLLGIFRLQVPGGR